MSNKGKMYAVLTGDIVGSSRLDPAELRALMQRLRDGAKRFEQAFAGTVVGELDVFSGDGWQMLMPDWKRSLRAAIFMRALAKADMEIDADTRVAVGWGGVDVTSLNRGRISESTGEAFLRSGRALKAMKRQDRLTVACGEASGREALLRAALGLVDELARRWTVRQASKIAQALLGRGQEEIARDGNTSQPTVNRALQSAGWRGIEGLLEEVEHNSEKLLTGNIASGGYK